jgi:membrane fusion protein, multidrug efflux system
MEQELLEIEEGERHVQTKKKGYLLAALLAAAFIVAAFIGISMRVSERRALAKETEAIAIPSVTVVHASPEPPQQELVLPSTLQAYIESPIFARTNGYLGHWYKDIGSRLRKGELLAEIETPEIDQELMQARAARDQAAAQLKLAQSSAKRWEDLQKMDAVSQQETDERSSSSAQGQASLAAATANVRRLEQLESFKHIYSPFSGVLTRRNTDVGSLVNAGNTGPNQELFVVAQIDPIRIYVDVPENYSPSIRKGVPADIQIPELVGEHFTGSVVRSAESIDPATRTLRTEIDVQNSKGRLLPGSYAQIHFALKQQIQRLTVPTNALLFRAEGPRAAVVAPDGKVQLKPVAIGRDFGTSVEILSGVALTDQIVLSPSDSLEDGQQVQITPGGGQQ